MRVYISADMEGVAGIVNDSFTDSKGQNYHRGCKLQTEEVNACIQGALEAGADQVLVNDSHGAMTNIIVENIDNKAELITGAPKPLGMMEGVADGIDAAFFTGYHSGQKQAGVLSHTYNYSVAELKVNGISMGETGINALVAGYYNVPVALVSGDDRVTEEAANLLGTNVVTAAIKTSLSRTSAKTLTPLKAQELLREKSKKAILGINQLKPWTMTPPYNLELSFNDRGMAEKARLLPGAELAANSTLMYQTEDIRELYDAFRTMLVLAR